MAWCRIWVVTVLSCAAFSLFGSEKEPEPAPQDPPAIPESVDNNFESEKGPTDHQEPAVRFLTEVDYLFWQSHLSGLESNFGASSIVDTNTGTIAITDIETFDIDPKFQWTSGVRLGFSTLFERLDLEVYADWTYFKNKGTRISSGDDEVNKGSCRVSLNQIDATLSYQYYSHSVKIKPFLGVRAAQINQSVNAQVTTDMTVFSSPLSVDTHLDDHQYFKGIGPILGFTGDWECGLGCGLYGLAGFGLLYGDYQLDFDDTDSYSAPFLNQSHFINHQHLHRFNIDLDLAIGFLWHTCIKERVEAILKIGFEYHGYFNQSYLSTSRGDLSFSGLTASFGVSF